MGSPALPVGLACLTLLLLGDGAAVTRSTTMAALTVLLAGCNLLLPLSETRDSGRDRSDLPDLSGADRSRPTDLLQRSELHPSLPEPPGETGPSSPDLPPATSRPSRRSG